MRESSKKGNLLFLGSKDTAGPLFCSQNGPCGSQNGLPLQMLLDAGVPNEHDVDTYGTLDKGVSCVRRGEQQQRAARLKRTGLHVELMDRMAISRPAILQSATGDPQSAICL